jgi:hypothetical protein
LELEVPVEKDGRYGIEMVLTKAHDYGIVRLSLGGQTLGPDVDLYNSPDVITTGVLTSDPLELKAGNHRLTVEIVGAHPQAQPGYMFGLDYVRLVPQ